MAKQSVLIPAFVFAGIVVLLWFGFQLSDPHLLPSQKLNDPVPDFELPSLTAVGETLNAADLTGENFLAECLGNLVPELYCGTWGADSNF